MAGECGEQHLLLFGDKGDLGVIVGDVGSSFLGTMFFRLLRLHFLGTSFFNIVVFLLFFDFCSLSNCFVCKNPVILVACYVKLPIQI